MSVIVVSKKAHYALKSFSIVLSIVAVISLAANIKMLTDVNTYKDAYEATANIVVDISKQLSKIEEENKELSDTLQKKKVAIVAASAEADCLAKNIYFEAGSEPLDGKKAVADVVYNRMKHPEFPKTACGVVYQGAHDDQKGCQFSWACDGMDKAIKIGSQAWQDSKKIAIAVLLGRKSGDVDDITNGALYFHNKTVKPQWASADRFVLQVGGHKFYK